MMWEDDSLTKENANNVMDKIKELDPSLPPNDLLDTLLDFFLSICFSSQVIIEYLLSF